MDKKTLTTIGRINQQNFHGYRNAAIYQETCIAGLNHNQFFAEGIMGLEIAE